MQLNHFKLYTKSRVPVINTINLFSDQKQYKTNLGMYSLNHSTAKCQVDLSTTLVHFSIITSHVTPSASSVDQPGFLAVISWSILNHLINFEFLTHTLKKLT
jgi:hypothetical protein